MATRNRPGVVALSLPLLLSQTRRPAQVVIVDSSEDGAPIEALARAADGTAGVPVLYLRAEAGLTLQRNQGLALCRSDVVILPDDDSLLYPDAAERILEVYELDAEGAVAAVCAREAQRPPGEGLGLEAVAAERRARPGARRLRQRLKERLAPLNPFLRVGHRLNARHPWPPWAEGMGVRPVPYMTGFRMSFRRAVLEREPFDETLGRYGWFEDIDASFRAMRHGLVVAATRAAVHHHRVAGPRGDGRAVGLWAVLNRAYVVMKAVDAHPGLFDRERERRRLGLYCLGRALAYRAMARDAFGLARAEGAREGLRRLGALTAARGPELARLYAALSEG